MLRGLAWTFIAVSSACSGPKFTSDDCSRDCAGQSSGGAAGSSGTTGGTTSGEGGEATGGVSGTGAAGAGTGGTGTSGSDSGGTGTGGTDTGGTGTGGTDTGGSSGSAGSTTSDFPRYGVLDDFAREGPELGGNWSGATASYSIESETLSCTADFCPGTFWAERFGAAQEVFATLVSFSSDSPEINLVLKAQSSATCDLLEILYAPALERLSVEACWDRDGNWHSFGFVDIALEPGDQLGGRIGPDGFVELFRNGIRVGRFDANDFPLIDSIGRIGLDGLTVDGQPLVWDDFGGGGE